MVQSRDITEDFNYIITQIAKVFYSCFDFLSSIEFLGTNLLSFSVGIIVVSALFSVVFTLSSRNARTLSRDTVRNNRRR